MATHTGWKSSLTSALGHIDARYARKVTGAAAPTVAVLGDSQVEQTTWTDTLAALTGATVHKLGIGGTRLTSASSNANYNALSVSSIAAAITTNTWTDQDAAVAALIPTGDDNSAILAALKTVNWATVDWVLVMAGTNDFQGSTPVGTRTDTTPTTVRGAMHHIITTLLGAFPHLRLAFLTPLFRSRQVLGDGKDSDTYPNAASEWLWEHVEAIADEARRRHVPCLDLNRISGINAQTATTFLSDGLHLNATGDGQVGRLVAQFLAAPITAPAPQPIRMIGTYNIGIGDSTHTVPPSGQFNIAIGPSAHRTLTSGSFNTASGLNCGQNLTTGSDNAQHGYAAGRSVTTGGKNTHVGSGAAYFAGGVVGNATTTASGQTSVGYRSGQGSATQVDNITTIGQAATASAVRATAVGSAANAAHADSVALGANTSTTAPNQVELGARHIEMVEVTAPGVAPANGARLYARDNGAGKTQLVVIFATGAEVVLATEA